MSHAVIIPVYRADNKTIRLCDELISFGIDNIVVVDDGCPIAAENFFNELISRGCHIVRIDTNKGKGASIKEGIKYAYNNLFNITGFITADADGQHKASDIVKISRVLNIRPNELIIGRRKFKESNAPLKSIFGNHIASLYFKIITGKLCKDTQTGLRGIPIFLYKLAINTQGNHFDYEFNFLTKCADRKIPFYNVSINVDYTMTNQSSYRLFKDTYLIFKTPLRFATASVGCTIIDLTLFTLFTYLLPSSLQWNVVFATVLARIVSGGINFLINRKVIFKNNGKAQKQAIRFMILFFCIMCASTIFVSLLSFLPIQVTVIKAIVDLLLWSVNYIFQRKWVFKESK